MAIEALPSSLAAAHAMILAERAARIQAEANATGDELAAEAASRSTPVMPHQRKRPARKPLPDHLPRERVVVPAPTTCPCCGSNKLSKLGEDITETLGVVPRQWKVIQTVREKFSCRQCEKITQPPAPFHVTPRGFAGPNLLAMCAARAARQCSTGSASTGR